MVRELVFQREKISDRKYCLGTLERSLFSLNTAVWAIVNICYKHNLKEINELIGGNFDSVCRVDTCTIYVVHMYTELPLQLEDCFPKEKLHINNCRYIKMTINYLVKYRIYHYTLIV